MSREIKFRAWIPQPREWINDVDLKDLWNSGRAFEEHGTSRYEAENIQGVRWEFDDLVFVQFTGFTDKSGREIYEGDILFSHALDFSRTNEDRWIADAGAPLPGGSLLFTHIESDPLKVPTVFNDTGSLEIIGNIYENPDLLSAKEQ